MAERRDADRKIGERRKAGAPARPLRGGLDHPQTLDFRRKNWILLGAGGLSILVGFLVLSTGEITLAPILILAGYLVLIPWGLVSRPRSPEPESSGPAREP